jgi:hypothetical protein
MKRKAYVVVSTAGPACPRCGVATEVREHDRITNQHRRQPFYYRQWYCCMERHCVTTTVMPREHRVWNEPQPSTRSSTSSVL